MSLIDRIGATVRGLRPARAAQSAGPAASARRSPFALLSRETLRVHLGPQQMHCVVLRGGKPVATQHFVFSNPTGHWQAALDMLRSLLLQPEHAAARRPLEISLSHRWCQLVLAPWSDVLLSEPGAARFLQTQLAAVYGDDARSWSIAADDAPYGQPRVVCGTDSALLQAIRDIAHQQQHRCLAVEPALSAILGSHARDRAGAPPPALALVEGGRLTMAALAAGRITALQSQPCGGKWTIELPQAWQRWTLRAPELAGIDQVIVINLDAEPALASALPSRFQLAGRTPGWHAQAGQEAA